MAASGRRGGVAYARRRPGPSLRRGRRAARSQLGRGGRAAQRSGPNKLAAGKAEPRWHAFARQYRDPMQIELLAAGIGSIYPLKQLGTGILLILLNTPLGDRADMVYMNTNVTRGAGEFVVTATGMATEVGHISGMLAEEPDLKTPSPASRRDPQSGAAANRRAAGDAGQAVTSSSSRMSTTPRAINAAPTTASCSAQVRTWPVSVMTPSLVSAVTSLPSGTAAERSSASWTCRSTSTGSTA